MPLTNYVLHVPVIIGTNVIGRCRNKFKDETSVPDNWKDAFVACQTESPGLVKSTNKVTVSLRPNESIILSGKDIEITPKTKLCELQEVKVLKNLDLETEAGENVQGCQQTDKETTL